MVSAPKIASCRPALIRYSEASVPTRFGLFKLIVYREPSGLEHVAIVRGDVERGEDVLVRVHSECFTGEVLHSLKCDCRGQLDLALSRIAEENRGAVVYLKQEGRGIGLGNKIRAYALQERGADTVDANRMLGFEPDARRYHVASEMIRDLGIRSVVLMTNNPAKVSALEADGIVVTRRQVHRVEANQFNEDYLETKLQRMGHRYTDD